MRILAVGLPRGVERHVVADARILIDDRVPDGAVAADAEMRTSRSVVGVGIGGVYVNTGFNGCLQQRWVETRRGMRLRTVNVCAY